MKVQELKQEMDAGFARVDIRFAAVDTKLAEIDAKVDKVDARFTEMERRIVDEGRETRRHFDVVAEQITSQVRTLAESVAASNGRVVTMESEGVTLLSALSDHELRLRVLEGTGRKRP